MHASYYMLKSLRIYFIIHLCHWCFLGNRHNSIWAVSSSCIILKSKEIIILDIRNVMAKLLIPVAVCALLATFYVLAVVQGKRNTNLNIRINSLDCFLGCLMRLYNYHIAICICCRNKCMRLRISEYFGILHCCQLHFLHRVREIKSNLNLSLHGVTTAFGCICHFRHHLLLKSLHESAYLKSHVGLIYGADILYLASKLLCDEPCIVGKKLYNLLIVPASQFYKPHR